MRLIDADKLKKELDTAGIIDTYGRQILITIDNAPTVKGCATEVNISEGNYMAFALISKQALEEIHDDNWFCGAVAIDIMSWARGHGMDAKELAERVVARVEHELSEEDNKE